ncbi:hypothetical protein [Nonomuraea jabiensis]|uniref:hypothetical protein n=1 Tax=Nonomuraea jabiensis TaxID=882448 RepID=UPI003F4D73E6
MITLWDRRALRALVVVIVARFELPIDGVGDRLVGSPDRVLVDHGGQEPHLIDHIQDEGIFEGRRVRSLNSGKASRTLVHDVHSLVEQISAVSGIGRKASEILLR